MSVSFMSIIHEDKARTFHVKSYNADVGLGNDTNETINKLFKSFSNNYPK